MTETTGNKISFGQKCCHEGCNKKLKLTDMTCRCGKRFCPKHRYAEEHNCSFNYQETARQQLAKKNPLVNGNKMGEVI